MEEIDDKAFSLRDFYYVLFRHNVSIVFLLFVTLSTVIVGVSLWPETYQAKARILVKVGRENVSLPAISPSSQQQVVASLGVRKEDINSEIEILTSRPIVEEVASKLGIAFIIPDATRPEALFKRIKYDVKKVIRKIEDFVNGILYKIDFKKKLSLQDEVILALQGMFSAKQVRFSDVIEVQFRWSSPDIAEKILDTWMDLYMAHHSDVHRTSGGYEFFQRQVEVLERTLIDSENRLKSLKESKQITSYENQISLLLGQLSSFRASLKATQTELAEANTSIEQIREKMSSLRKRITAGFGTVYGEAEKELLLEEVRVEALGAKKQKLEQHVESYLKDIEKLSLTDIELRRLDRQIRIDEQNYELYRKKLEEARISDVLDAERIVNVKIIQPAAASPKPVWPNKLVIIAVGLMLSLVIGIGFAFLSEYIDHSIRTAEHVSSYLDLPLLASIQEGNK